MDDFFFSGRRRHTRFDCDWSSDVCSSDLVHFHRGTHIGIPVNRPQMEMLRANSQHHVPVDRKSTRLNSSHSQISYAVFCLKKKKKKKKNNNIKKKKKKQANAKSCDSTT